MAELAASGRSWASSQARKGEAFSGKGHDLFAKDWSTESLRKLWKGYSHQNPTTVTSNWRSATGCSPGNGLFPTRQSQASWCLLVAPQKNKTSTLLPSICPSPTSHAWLHLLASEGFSWTDRFLISPQAKKNNLRKPTVVDSHTVILVQYFKSHLVYHHTWFYPSDVCPVAHCRQDWAYVAAHVPLTWQSRFWDPWESVGTNPSWNLVGKSSPPPFHFWDLYILCFWKIQMSKAFFLLRHLYIAWVSSFMSLITPKKQFKLPNTTASTCTVSYCVGVSSSFCPPKTKR